MILSENHIIFKTLYDFFEPFDVLPEYKAGALTLMLQRQKIPVVMFDVMYAAVVCREDPSQKTRSELTEKWRVINFELGDLIFFEGQWREVSCSKYWQDQLLSQPDVISARVSLFSWSTLIQPPVDLANAWTAKWEQYCLDEQTMPSPKKMVGLRL
jgi:hypothetical protein